MAYGLVGTALSQSVAGSNNLGTTVASADAVLKQWYYDKQNLNQLLYAEDEVLKRLQRLPASEVIEGREMVVPVRIGGSPSQSKDFTKAQEQAKARTGARGRWIVPIDEDYAVVRISNKAIKASKNKMGAFVKLLADETDAEIERLKQRRCTAIFAPSSGGVNNKRNVIGEVKSVTAAKVTLKDKGRIANFEIGDQLQFLQSSGAARGAVVGVVNVDRSEGVITLTAAVSGLAANDLVVRDGDRGKVGLAGFNEWITGGSTPGSLFGLDRNLDPVRLAGFSVDIADSAPAPANAQGPFTKNVRKTIAKIINLTNTAPTMFVCNSLVEDFIAQEQSTNLRLDMSTGGVSGVTNIGMGKLAFKHSKGMTEIVTSSFCPVGTCYLIDERTWSLHYLGDQGDDFVDFVKNDRGGIIIPAYDGPGLEIRAESFGNLVCQAPGKNAKFNLAQQLQDRIE